MMEKTLFVYDLLDLVDEAGNTPDSIVVWDMTFSSPVFHPTHKINLDAYLKEGNRGMIKVVAVWEDE